MSKNHVPAVSRRRWPARSQSQFDTASLALKRVRNIGFTAIIAAAVYGAPALAQPAIWSIKDEDSIIYVMGTVHLLRPEMQWKTETLDAAIDAAEELWLELPTTDPQAMAGDLMPLITKYGLSPGRPLSTDLSQDEMTTLDEAARLTGLNGEQLNLFRPWFAALMITTAAVTRAGYDPASGIDSKIEAAFKQRGVKPNGLETLEKQLQVFASLSWAEELAYLRDTINQYRNASTELDKIVDQWSRADLPAMEATFVTRVKSETPALYEALLVNRNSDWATKIEEILRGKGTSFIAVGAGHLVGDESVLAMLEARGIEVTRTQ